MVRSLQAAQHAPQHGARAAAGIKFTFMEIRGVTLLQGRRGYRRVGYLRERGRGRCCSEVVG
jgi:hypothetical protein